MDDDQKEGIVHPPAGKRPRELRETPDAPSIDEAVARAEARIAEIVNGKPDRADDDLARLTATCAAAEKDPENIKQHLDDLYACAHELKGMGGNFGYPVVTEIAALLCKYIQQHDPADIRVVGLHVDSLRLVFDHNLSGDDSPEGRVLIERLSTFKNKDTGDDESF
jgi:hypothetical protein